LQSQIFTIKRIYQKPGSESATLFHSLISNPPFLIELHDLNARITHKKPYSSLFTCIDFFSMFENSSFQLRSG